MFDGILDLKRLGGEFAELYNAVQDGKNVYAMNLDRGSKMHVAASLDRFVVYVTGDRVSAREARDRLEEYFGVGKVGLLQEKDDVLVYNRSNQSYNVSSRMETLYALSDNELKALAVPAEALVQFLPSIDALRNGAVDFVKGREYDMDYVVEVLTGSGYTREEVVAERGSFSVKGDILSIYPYSGEAVRLTFFDTELESIKIYDVDTMMSVREIENVRVLPCSDMLFDREYLNEYVKKIDGLIAECPSNARKRLLEIKEMIDEDISSKYIPPSLSWLIPFVRKGMSVLYDYLPKDTVIIYDEPKIVDDKIKAYLNEFHNRLETLKEEGEALKIHRFSLLARDISYEKANTYTQVSFQNIASLNPIFSASEAVKFRTVPITQYYMNYPALVSDIKNFTVSGVKVILCCRDKDTARSIGESLMAENVGSTYYESLENYNGGVALTSIGVSYGFNYSGRKTVVIGANELIKKRDVVRSGKSKRRTFTIPKCGDYVVHEAHGIGKCVGIERLRFDKIERDYVIVQYKGSDKLYLPIDQMDTLSRYSGSDKEPSLSKLGGKEFGKLKERVKASVKSMAVNLVDLYAKRRQVRGYKYSEDTSWQKEFEDEFEFTETEDQLNAVNEIKKDMENGVVMDRLLCGDVGFGKTEVALRAVFKTIVEGKQAAILAPTTILARQHYNTVLARFNKFKVNAVILSRFQTKKEIAQSLEDIRTGKASIIVATHRLLSKDVEFQDLGLIVLDEEQRFGVEHKEKLKLVNNSVNILTLSATPIPRTLNMALTGVRDISLLETPPTNRVPIQTYVTELTDGLIKDAVERELARGGQVFVLHNRVQGIEKFASRIAELVPSASVIVGYGQMDANTLEENIMRFYNKEANVLVCTTIIENGIDLPDANTLIVADADKLGLAALYQLRGRVGRSDRMAYAYFTTKTDKVMTTDAMKRLSAVMEYTEFGSGFKIAMRDLEIRGAGNILGREQHGHIEKVGYEMYCKLLEEAVEELSAAKGGAPYEKKREGSAEVSVELDAYLADEYVSLSSEKMRIYREIAEIRDEKDKERLLATLTESYGVPPRPLVNLAEVGFIKNMATKIGAAKVNVSSKITSVEFPDTACLKNENVIFAVSDMQGECTLMPTTKPMVVFETKDMLSVNKLYSVEKFLKKCCGIF